MSQGLRYCLHCSACLMLLVQPSSGQGTSEDSLITLSTSVNIEGKVFRIIGDPSDKFVFVDSPMTTNSQGKIKVSDCYSSKIYFFDREELQKESDDPCGDAGGWRIGPDYVIKIFSEEDGKVKDLGILKYVSGDADSVVYEYTANTDSHFDVTKITRTFNFNGKEISTLDGDRVDLTIKNNYDGYGYLRVNPDWAGMPPTLPDDG
ncbi:hypothetical protein [Defluviimonas sp. SAOS-178_SWC]|uniref:hypothetical protein n=1 Tax=Defluviimonas sp. SAOS-178_SWC TaxID=3121287 RepID=UPI0032215DF0